MNSIKRVYLAGRAAVAEMNPLMYLIPIGLMLVLTVFTSIVSDDIDQEKGQLINEFLFWDPITIIGLITNAGWISGLILCGVIHNRWFKEENQAVRTLSLPLSNGERFATMLLLYLGFVPLICFGLPLLLTFLFFAFAPGTIFLPAGIYLWKVLLLGFLVHAVTTSFWLLPTLVFRKKVAFVLIAMVCMIVTYIVYTHGSITEPLEVPYPAAASNSNLVVGMADYALSGDPALNNTIDVKYTPNESTYYFVQTLFLLVMLLAAGLFLTKKTA